jgi:hypothetical protein
VICHDDVVQRKDHAICRHHGIYFHIIRACGKSRRHAFGGVFDRQRGNITPRLEKIMVGTAQPAVAAEH